MEVNRMIETPFNKIQIDLQRDFSSCKVRIIKAIIILPEWSMTVCTNFHGIKYFLGLKPTNVDVMIALDQGWATFFFSRGPY